jgi:hypothetical protein
MINESRDSGQDEHASYIRQQFARLGDSARYQVKVRGPEGETHWISVSAFTVSRMLTEDKARGGA